MGLNEGRLRPPFRLLAKSFRSPARGGMAAPSVVIPVLVTGIHTLKDLNKENLSPRGRASAGCL